MCTRANGRRRSCSTWTAASVKPMGRRKALPTTAISPEMKRRYFRGDAAFANPEIREFLEAEAYKCTIRLPTDAILQESIGWLLNRPVDRPPHEVRRYDTSFRYQAGSWTKPRRVVAKVERHRRAPSVATRPMLRTLRALGQPGFRQETRVPMQTCGPGCPDTRPSSTGWQGSGGLPGDPAVAGRRDRGLRSPCGRRPGRSSGDSRFTLSSPHTHMHGSRGYPGRS